MIAVTDRLQEEGRPRWDTHLREYRRGKVLHQACAGYLAAGLDQHDDDRAAECGLAFEEVEMGFGLLGVLGADRGLDEMALGDDVGVWMAPWACSWARFWSPWSARSWSQSQRGLLGE